MMDPQESRRIAEESLSFFRKFLDVHELAIPFSQLPYPKQLMKKAFLKHAPELVEMSGGWEKAKLGIVVCYCMFSICLRDKQVELMVKMENFLDGLTFPMSEEDKKAFLLKKGTETEVERYLEIIKVIEEEHSNCMSEIVPRLARAGYVFEETGSSTKKVEPVPRPADSAQTLP